MPRGHWQRLSLGQERDDKYHADERQNPDCPKRNRQRSLRRLSTRELPFSSDGTFESKLQAVNLPQKVIYRGTWHRIEIMLDSSVAEEIRGLV